MLLQFRIKNVRSFHDEAILDFTATGINEHEEHVRLKNRNKVLPIVATYGANAAGKTNLVSALYDMCDFIRTSVDSVEKEKELRFIFAPFIFQGEIQPAEFEITIALDKDYRYGFSIDYEAKVLTEYLEYRKATNGAFFRIFEREVGQPIKISGASILADEEASQIKLLNNVIGEKELLLTMLGRRKGSPSNAVLSRYAKIYDWVSGVAECPECKNRKIDLLFARENTQLSAMFSEGRAVNEYLKFVQKADPTIYDIRLEKENERETRKELGQQVLTNRRVDDDKPHLELPTILESSGTLYIMRTYPVIHQVLKTGGLLVADEIDRSLHPMLLLDIINLFTNPETNPNNAQLLCTMHNVIVMNRRVLRRDEIWFVEKNGKGESSLYSLADFKVNNDKSVRNDADFCKNYILGMYGAIPERP